MRTLDTRHCRRATRSTPRDVKRQIVLTLVREYQPVSRADLAPAPAVVAAPTGAGRAASPPFAVPGGWVGTWSCGAVRALYYLGAVMFGQ